MRFHVSDDMVAGAIAGVVARLIAAPFDILKIRSQLQTDSKQSTNGITSIIRSFKGIVKEEGYIALWKGNLSATYLWITYAMVQFTIFG